MDDRSGVASGLAAMRAALAGLSVDMPDPDRIDCIRQLEDLRGAVVAAQARLTAAFVASQRAERRAAGVPAERMSRGLNAQVALARRISPHRASRWVGFAMVAPTELPETFAELAAGRTSEWRATLVARETAWLSRDDRVEVDRAVAPQLAGWGDKRVHDETRRAAYTVDPHGYVEHLGKVEKDRHVSLCPAPDVMSRLSALLPVAQGVAVRAALGRAADTAKATGDPRTRGQIMADTLVQRCTGQATADGVAVEVQIVLPADVLFADTVGAASAVRDYYARDAARNATRGVERRAGCSAPANPTRVAIDTLDLHGPVDLDIARRNRDRSRREQHRMERRRRARDRRHEPALLLGYGPIPAAIARRLVLDRDAHAPTWIRRLYENPDTGDLVAMTSRRREFTAAQRTFIATRDQQCRTPFCDAPIRHVDHAEPWAQTRRTDLRTADGLCEACNHAKQARGWSTTVHGHGAAPAIVITTPTGHGYLSHAP